jgi:hypothetical protein
MIEINITTKEAVTYLTARISEEKRLRVKAGLLPSETKLTRLTYKEILPLAEAAAFDLVFLLPTDVFVEESNLPEIITKAFNELAKIYGHKEFLSFSIENANNLVKPIKKIIADTKFGDKYKQN